MMSNLLTTSWALTFLLQPKSGLGALISPREILGITDYFWANYTPILTLVESFSAGPTVCCDKSASGMPFILNQITFPPTVPFFRWFYRCWMHRCQGLKYINI